MEADAFDRTVCISKRKFTYDAVYDADVSNEELYGSVAPPLLDAFLNGYNATVRKILYCAHGVSLFLDLQNVVHLNLQLPLILVLHSYYNIYSCHHM